MKSLALSSEPNIALSADPGASVRVGQPVRITASAPSPNVVWHVDPPDGFGLLPADWSDSLNLYAEPTKVGQYSVYAVGSGPSGGAIGWGKLTIAVTAPPGLWTLLQAQWPWLTAKVRSLFTGGAWSYILTILLGIAVGYLARGGLPFDIHWPTPAPAPTPPAPPAPIPAAGLRVLIVYDVTQALPAAQQNVLDAQTIRTYLVSKCAKGADGKTPEYRIVDQKADFSNESDLWRQAIALKRDSLPWIVISDGTTGFSGPLPGTVDDAMKLLQKYGG